MEPLVHSLLGALEMNLGTIARFFFFFLSCPFFSESSIPKRVQLLLSTSLAISISLDFSISNPPTAVSVFISAVSGLCFGLLARIVFETCLMVSGFLSQQLSVSGQQGGLFSESTDFFSVFFRWLFLLIFLRSDYHLLFLKMLSQVDIFDLLKAGGSEEFILWMLKSLSSSLSALISLAAPFLLASILYVLALGLINRLIPTLSVFFIMRPMDFLVQVVILWACFPRIVWFFQNVFLSVFFHPT